MARLLALLLAVSALTVILSAGVDFWWHDTETIPWTTALERGAPGQFLETSQGVTHYELRGDGSQRTVVLVPGYSVPYYIWDATYSALCARGFRVLRYDLFGRGLSERPRLRYDGDVYDRQLADLLDGLGIRGRVDIVGASAGGPIAGTFVCRHPERVRTVAFLDPGFTHGSQVARSLRFPVIGEFLMATRDMPRMPREQTEDFAHPERFPHWADRFREQMRIRGFRRALLSTRRTYFAEDWSKGYACLGALRFPVLLIWGRQDRAVPIGTSGELMSLMPGTQFLAIDDAGHLPMLEQPELVNAALQRFWDAHP